MKKLWLSILPVAFINFACSDSSSSSGNVTLKSSGAVAARLFGASDPSSLKLKVYKFAVSTNADCSSPTTVYESSSPEYVEFGSSTTIGSGALADGSYPCIMFEISDLVKFTPSQNDGDHCVAGEEETLEVCADHGSGAPAYQLVDGTTGTCGTGEDRVAMYISTNSASSGAGDSNAFQPPTSSGDADRGLKLTGAFTVSGTATALFVVDATGKVNNGGDTSRCDMQPPTFAFASE